MIGKRKAQEMAREEKLTVGDLRVMIANASSKSGFSSINPMVPFEKVRSIYLGALEGRDSLDILKAWRPDIYSSRPGAVKPSRDFLLVTNILRDCAP